MNDSVRKHLKLINNCKATPAENGCHGMCCIGPWSEDRCHYCFPESTKDLFNNIRLQQLKPEKDMSTTITNRKKNVNEASYSSKVQQYYQQGATKLPIIYLAGAIRDGNKNDIQWREDIINRCNNKAVFLNPVGGKTYDNNAKTWSLHSVEPKAKVIVDHDFWCVDRADIVIFNFTALSEGYPNIGTLVEFGRASSFPSLKYSIIDANYAGHQNQSMYKLHPFLEINSSIIFNSIQSLLEFLPQNLDNLSGANSHFGGYI